MKLTITIDPDRVEKFADPEETLADFVRRVAGEARTGGQIVWTSNAANVGTVDAIDYTQAAAAPIRREATEQQREALRRIGQATRKCREPLDDTMLGLIEQSALAQADYFADGHIEWTPDSGGMPGHTTWVIESNGATTKAMIA